MQLMRNMPVPQRFFIGVTILLCIGVVIACWLLAAEVTNSWAATPEEGEPKALPIINALGNYKKEHGYYPAKLESLVPQYLNEIPTPDWKNQYFYMPYPSEINRQEYILSFTTPGPHWDCYASWASEWTDGDSSCWFSNYPEFDE